VSLEESDAEIIASLQIPDWSSITWGM